MPTDEEKKFDEVFGDETEAVNAEDQTEETTEATDAPDIGNQDRKMEIDGEELTQDQIAEIVRTRRSLEKENAKLAKQHKEIQRLATRKGVAQEDIARITEPEQQRTEAEDDEFDGMPVERDKRYLKRMGVVTQADIEAFKAEMREQFRSEMQDEIKTSSTVLSVSQEIDAAVKQFPFASKAEIVDYMHFKANQRDADGKPIYFSPEQAVQRLYPGEFKAAPKPQQAKLPVTDKSSNGVVDAPPGKVIGFDNPAGMARALEEILFPDDQV